MRYEEALKEMKKARVREKPKNEEHRLQCQMIKVFRLQYPKLKDVLFAVPNGGRRDSISGKKLKDEGVIAGVSDLILLKSNHYYGSLCIEVKTPQGTQSKAQQEWQRQVELQGNKYVICRSVDDFIKQVTIYLKNV